MGTAVAVAKGSGALQLVGVAVVCVARLGCVAAGDSQLSLRFAGDGELSVQSIIFSIVVVVVELLVFVSASIVCADNADKRSSTRVRIPCR